MAAARFASWSAPARALLCGVAASSVLGSAGILRAGYAYVQGPAPNGAPLHGSFAERSSTPRVHRVARQGRSKSSMDAFRRQAAKEVSALLQEARRLRAETAVLETKAAEQRDAARRQLFDRFLSHGSDGIDASQLRELLRELGHEVNMQVSRIVLDYFDRDGDHVLKYHEFQPERFLRITSQALGEMHDKEAKMTRRWHVIVKKRQMLAGLPAPNTDTSWPVRILSVAPYALPAYDGLRLFSADHVPSNFPEVQAALTRQFEQAPQELCSVVLPLVQCALFFGLPMLAIRRQLPLLLRWNVNQAYTLNLLVFFLYSPFFLAGVASAGAMDTPSAPVANAFLLLLALCVAYSVASTLLGRIPADIPYMSSAVHRSMGTYGLRSHSDVHQAAAEGREKPRH
mmetsp:Transcript_31176/g.85440  ORF Transcript_31176/g.85440 Transcript_31176/m.85440 type:complete len:400 (-) Transcript_31176:342-1541(-)